jgi:type III restriction enzyme
MNIELKTFQDKSVRDLLRAITKARIEVADGVPQSVALSSPTGSGKTITVAALMEKMLEGDESLEGCTPNPNATFLWFSHDPELNKQSREKILRTSTRFRDYDLVLVDNSFQNPVFEPGKVYFLNTNKLSKTSGLTSKSDERQKTIWEVINDTARERPQDFVLVIDEAHRGMTVDALRDENEAHTIVQKFIRGSEEVQPVKLILGMSATPQRFRDLIAAVGGRTERSVAVESSAVIESGLLKDRIIIRHLSKQKDEFALLENAVQTWKGYTESWDLYCMAQGIPVVHPILVVQVEDATQSSESPSRTDLAKAIDVIERGLGRGLSEKELAHSFQDDKAISVSEKLRIRKLDASAIQEDPDVRFVFFKMSLTTGWDCPRAEVMMSFRVATDYTVIAQLVGRMVRTPLARRIENSDLLNSVQLYLPKYNEEQLERVVNELADPENQTPITVELEEELETVSLDAAKTDLKTMAEALPSYTVETVRKTTAVKRLMKLCRGLAYHEVNTEELDKAKNFIVNHLCAELEKIKDNSEFKSRTTESGEIEVGEIVVENGTFKRTASQPVKLKVSPENIDRLFRSCGTLLGEGLHLTYWKARTDQLLSEPNKAKLELFVLLQWEGILRGLEAACVKEFDRIRNHYKEQIKKLPSSERLFYTVIAPKPKLAEDCVYPDSMLVKGAPLAKKKYKNPPFEAPKHLYINEKRTLWDYPQSGWEAYVVKKFCDDAKTVGWIRNLPKKPWSLAVSCDKGGVYAPTFPDYIVFSDVNGNVFPSIIDPHNEAYEDSEKRAIGLATYAEQHGDHFQQILLITKEGEKYRALDLNRTDVRTRVYKAQSRSDIAAIRKDLGFDY